MKWNYLKKKIFKKAEKEEQITHATNRKQIA